MIRTNELSGRGFKGTFRFIDVLCALNDGSKFGTGCLEISPTKLGLNVEHKDSHATFLDLHIPFAHIDKGKFIYEMFDKRDTFLM